jgi:hypothetical protein
MKRATHPTDCTLCTKKGAGDHEYTPAPRPHQTIVSSPQVAGTFAAEKRAEGYTVTVKATGSDSRRGTRPAFIVEWSK